MPVDSRRVLVVEDEPLMSSLLADVLFEHGFTVRTAVDVAQARREIDAFDPDVLLLDVSLGEGPTGIHLAHAMRLSRPDIAILVFTGHSDIASVNTDGLALPPGVGLLRKHLVSDKAYLIEALEKVLREEGNLVKKEEEAEDVFAFLGFNGSRALRMLAAGYDNEEIALRCTVSRKTVERWIEQIYRDLGIDTKGSLNPRVAAARRFFFAIGVPGTEK
ncbi:MAG: response regulator [Actinobacteria bacterium]|nr:response regulator [Actinomycetota bacterium]